MKKPKIDEIKKLFSIIDISNWETLKIIGDNNLEKLSYFLDEQLSRRNFLLSKICLEFLFSENVNHLEHFLKSNEQIVNITLNLIK